MPSLLSHLFFFFRKYLAVDGLFEYNFASVLTRTESDPWKEHQTITVLLCFAFAFGTVIS